MTEDSTAGPPRRQAAYWLVLRQEPARGPQADRRALVSSATSARAVQRHHPGGDDGGRAGVDQASCPSQEINGTLDQYVIGRPRAKKILSVAVYNPLQATPRSPGVGRVEIAKSNILPDRPDRLGQDSARRDPGAAPHVPFTIADATTLTEAGYVGEDSRHHPELLQKCTTTSKGRRPHRLHRRDRQDLPQSTHPSITRGRVRRGGAAGAAQAHRGDRRSVPPQGGRKHPQQEFCRSTPATSLFIVGGAFAGLEKVIRARSQKGGIGFSPRSRADDRRNLGEVLTTWSPRISSATG